MSGRHGKQYHIPKVVQGYADASGVVSGSSGRICAGCGARMRRGHDQHRTECDPCYSVTHPHQAPEPATIGPDTCAWCERPYTAWHKQQKYCSMNCGEHARQTRFKTRKARKTSAPSTP